MANLADEREANRTRKLENIATAQLVADVSAVARTAEGRRLLERLIEYAQTDTVTCGGETTHATAFNEGQRSVGLKIQTLIWSAAPEAWMLILRERLEKEYDNGRRTRDSNRIRTDRDDGSDGGDG